MNENINSSSKISKAEETKINKSAEKVNNLKTKDLHSDASNFIASRDLKNDSYNIEMTTGASSFMAPEVTQTLEEAQQYVEGRTLEEAQRYVEGRKNGAGDRAVELAAAKEYRKSLHNEIKTRLLKDLDWRILNRGKVWKFTSIFFAIQNLIVFGIVGASFAFKPAFDLTTVFSIIIPVSLGTTAYAIKEVTKFLFNEVDYTQYLDRIERFENAEVN